MVYRLLIIFLFVTGFCFGQDCKGVLVRIKNTGTAKTRGYTIEINKKVFQYMGLKPGGSTGYICLPSFSKSYPLSISFSTAGPITIWNDRENKISYHGKLTIELYSFKDSTVKPDYESGDIWEKFNCSEKVVIDK